LAQQRVKNEKIFPSPFHFKFEKWLQLHFVCANNVKMRHLHSQIELFSVGDTHSLNTPSLPKFRVCPTASSERRRRRFKVKLWLGMMTRRIIQFYLYLFVRVEHQRNHHSLANKLISGPSYRHECAANAQHYGPALQRKMHCLRRSVSFVIIWGAINVDTVVPQNDVDSLYNSEAAAAAAKQQ